MAWKWTHYLRILTYTYVLSNATFVRSSGVVRSSSSNPGGTDPHCNKPCRCTLALYGIGASWPTPTFRAGFWPGGKHATHMKSLQSTALDSGPKPFHPLGRIWKKPPSGPCRKIKDHQPNWSHSGIGVPTTALDVTAILEYTPVSIQNTNISYISNYILGNWYIYTPIQACNSSMISNANILVKGILLNYICH